MRDLPFVIDSALGFPALITITRGIESIRFTTYEASITIAGITWPAGTGANISNITFPSDTSPATLDVTIMATTGGAIEPGEAARGTLDGWPITIEVFDSGNPALGTFDWLPGAIIGNVSEDTLGIVTISVNGPLNNARGPMTEHYSLTGRENLGDDRCKIPIRPADIGRGVDFVRPDIATGLLAVDDAYGRIRTGTAGTVEDYENVYYECTVAGTTHATVVPTYDPTPGNSTVDGTATFIARNSWLRYARGQATDNYTITLTALPDSRASDAAWFVLGAIYICSGTLNGFPKIPIREWSPDALTLKTFLPVDLTDIPADTQFEIYVGCDQTRDMCFSRFNNIINLRAETFVPPDGAITGSF